MGYLYVKYLMACHNVIENEDGTLTFDHVFDRMELEIPGMANFFIAANFEYSLLKRDGRNITFSLVGPDGEKVRGNDLHFTLDETKKKEVMHAFNKIGVKNVPIDKEGDYSILVYHEENIVAGYDILFIRGERDE